jgi:hypothetical protein
MSQFDPSESRKPSRAQVRANRRNAKNSTGPRTPEGKRRSCMNATTHGVFCKSPVLPGERTGEYLAFRNLLLDSPGLKPQTWLELSLAEQFVLARWRIRRLSAAEAMTHDSIADDLAEVASMRKADFFNLMEQREKYLAMKQGGGSYEPDEGEQETDDSRQDEQLARQEALKRMFLRMHEEQRVPAAVTLMTSFVAKGDHNGAFERIDRLRQRLELSAHRALRELRQLRKDLGIDVSALPTCPFLEEIPEDEEEEDEHEPEDEDKDDTDDELRRGVVASDFDELSRVATTSPTSNAQNEQNEPNPDEPRAGDDASDGCAQGSRTIEPVVPTKLAPPRGARRASDDDAKEARDRR